MRRRRSAPARSARALDKMRALERGAWGERVAARHLGARGWRILARGYRGAGGEVDIVASRGRVVAFCEVKTRRTLGPIPPVGPAQALRIRRAALAFLASQAQLSDCDVRLDLLVVIPRGLGGARVHHYEHWLE